VEVGWGGCDAVRRKEEGEGGASRDSGFSGREKVAARK